MSEGKSGRDGTNDWANAIEYPSFLSGAVVPAYFCRRRLKNKTGVLRRVIRYAGYPGIHYLPINLAGFFFACFAKRWIIWKNFNFLSTSARSNFIWRFFLNTISCGGNCGIFFLCLLFADYKWFFNVASYSKLCGSSKVRWCKLAPLKPDIDYYNIVFIINDLVWCSI